MIVIRGTDLLTGTITFDKYTYAGGGEDSRRPVGVLYVSKNATNMSDQEWQNLGSKTLENIALAVDRGYITVHTNGVLTTSSAIRLVISGREDVSSSEVESLQASVASDLSTLHSTISSEIATALVNVQPNSWQKAIDVNLTQASNFTFTDTTNTWNGQPWVGANIATKTDSFGVVNGTGLVLNHNAQNTAWAPSTDTAPKISLQVSSLIPDFVWGQSELRVTAEFEVAGSTSYDLGGIAVEKAFVSNTAWTHKLYAGYVPGYQRYSQVLLENVESIGFLATNSEKVQRMWIKGPSFVQYSSRASGAVSNTDSNDIAFGQDMDYSIFGLWAPAVTATPRIKKASDAYIVIAAQTGNTANTCVLTIRRLRVEYKL